MSSHISIGRFANLTDLSPKFLRKLDERGLLSPIFVDPDTRYRYYDHSQVRVATLIRFCHQLGMPIADVRRLLATRDPDAVRLLFERQRERMARALADQQGRLALLVGELSRSTLPLAYEVTLRDDPARLVAGATGVATRVYPHDPYALEDRIVAVGARVMSWLEERGLAAAGNVIVCYVNDLEEGEEMRFEVCVPVSPEAGRLRDEVGAAPGPEPGLFRLPAARLAVTVHEGPYDTVWNAHAAVLSWVLDQGLRTAGPTRETGLVQEFDTPDPREWVTEISVPVSGD